MAIFKNAKQIMFLALPLFLCACTTSSIEVTTLAACPPDCLVDSNPTAFRFRTHSDVDINTLSADLVFRYQGEKHRVADLRAHLEADTVNQRLLPFRAGGLINVEGPFTIDVNSVTGPGKALLERCLATPAHSCSDPNFWYISLSAQFASGASLPGRSESCCSIPFTQPVVIIR